jgi:PAS domain S-box-containing protein
MEPVSGTPPSSPQPLKVLLLQPNRERADQIIAELEAAGFRVQADIVENLTEFEERLSVGGYDLALNGLEFASAVQRIEQQRQQAEEAALEAAGEVHALLEACPLGVISLDLGGNIRMWSRGAEQIFGWTEQEVIGKKLPTVPQDQEQEYLQLLQAQFRGASHAGIKVRRRRKNGSVVELSLWTVPLRDVRGVITGNIAILADLTAVQATEQRYQDLLIREGEVQAQLNAERRFRELLEAAPDGIMQVDAEGRIGLVNAGVEKLSGYRRNELLGQKVEMLLPSELKEKHVGHRADYWRDPVTRPMGTGLKLQLQRKDGTRVPVEISLSPVRYDGSFQVTAIIRDVGERTRAEQQIRELHSRLTAEMRAKNQELELRNREIQRANRLKTEFVASISHELRTPLHTIIGFSELMEEELEGPLNEKQKRFIDYIHKDALHLLELINDVLDLSRIEAGRLDLRPETFDLMTAVDEALATIRPQAVAKSIQLGASVPESLSLDADRLRFKQILYNLLSNAVKFTPEGGAIHIDAAARESFVEISVSDTGIGIPLEEQAAIFDQFHQVGSTTRGVKEGTGLGLAITKQLVEAHGCRIWLKSEPGRGSRFCFTIPKGGGEI